MAYPTGYVQRFSFLALLPHYYFGTIVYFIEYQYQLSVQTFLIWNEKVHKFLFLISISFRMKNLNSPFSMSYFRLTKYLFFNNRCYTFLKESTRTLIPLICQKEFVTYDDFLLVGSYMKLLLRYMRKVQIVHKNISFHTVSRF